MQIIAVNQFLYEFTNSSKPCFLVFMTLDGKRREVARCLYGGQKRDGQKRKDKDKGNKSERLKENNRLPITDLDLPQGQAYREPRISHIIQYNNYIIRH